MRQRGGGGAIGVGEVGGEGRGEGVRQQIDDTVQVWVFNILWLLRPDG